MKLNSLINVTLFTALVLPTLAGATSLQSDAGVRLSICGAVSSASGSHYDQREQDNSKTDYSIQIDCNLNGKIDEKNDPVATIESLSSARRGWITRYRGDLARYAAKTEIPNPRFQKPYVCAEVEMDQNPCVTKAKDSKILVFEDMTGNTDERIKQILKKRVATDKQ